MLDKIDLSLNIYYTWGKAVTIVCVAGGVQNKFAKTIFSSSTEWSFNTLTALTTVFPVPVHKESWINLSS